jgi:RNA polymerase sigma factor (sigma-70 family)
MGLRSLPKPYNSPDHADYLAHLETLEQAVAQLVRRYRLRDEDAEEFAAEVSLRMVEQGETILGQFEGRSSMATYLYTVVNSLFWEWRNKRFGRWRPSVAATRLGPVALHLEELTVRDGLAFSEAVTILKTNYACSLTEAELEAIAMQFPARKRIQEVPGEALDLEASADTSPEADLLEREAKDQGTQVRRTIHHLLDRLSAEDQLVIKLHFYEDVKLVQVAQSLGYRPKVLYRKVEKLLKTMGKQLVSKGFALKDRQVLLDALRIAVLHEAEETHPWLSNKVEEAARGPHAS